MSCAALLVPRSLDRVLDLRPLLDLRHLLLVRVGEVRCLIRSRLGWSGSGSWLLLAKAKVPVSARTQNVKDSLEEVRIDRLP